MQCEPKSVRGADALPLRCGHGWLPAEIADGRRGVGDAFEGDDLLVGGECAFDCAFVGLDTERVGGVSGCDEDGKCKKRECEGQGPVLHEFSPRDKLIMDGGRVL